MDLYFIKTLDLTNTRVLVAPAVNVDRKVYVQEIFGTGQTNIAFSEIGDIWGLEPSDPNDLRDFIFPLPAGIELWAQASLNFESSKASFMITSIGR